MRRMTGKQKKPIISGNLGAAARDPRNGERRGERRRERRARVTERMNDRPKHRSTTTRCDASRARCNAARPPPPTTVRLSSANILAATLAPRLALRAPLRSFRRSFGCRRARARARAITQPACYNYNEYSTRSGMPATNHTSS